MGRSNPVALFVLGYSFGEYVFCVTRFSVERVLSLLDMTRRFLYTSGGGLSTHR